MARITTAQRLDRLEQQHTEQGETLKQISDRVAAIEKSDALQHHDLASIKETVDKMDDKVDMLVNFVSETRGGKKWMFGALAAIGGLLTIFAAFELKQ